MLRVGDPRLSPDGKTVAITVSRANLKDDRWDTEIDFVDVATKQLRVMTHDRLAIASVRWSPSGDRIAYLAQDSDKKAQIFIMPVGGGDSAQLTRLKTAISLLAWKPDGTALAYAAADEAPEKKDEAKFEDAFEAGNNGYLERARPLPTHLWIVQVANGEAKRVTSGAWSLPNHFAPSGPPSQICFTPDGGKLVFVKAESPLSGDANSSRLQLLDIASGAMHPITAAAAEESNPVLSPDGTGVAYTFSRDGKARNEEALYVASLSGGSGTDAAYALDRNISGAAWMPEGKSLLLSGSDGTRSTLWLQPIGGKARHMPLGDLNVAAFDVGKDGSVAFTATARELRLNSSTPRTLATRRFN